MIGACDDLDTNIKERLLGAIKGWRQASPGGVLRQLVDRGVVSTDQFAAWRRIRNRAAHAASFPLDDETVRDCDLVLTAAHRILFDVLGYEGAYTDYGAIGWPIINYPQIQ